MPKIQTRIPEKMKIEVQGGINWSWFKVQNRDLVAVFRLHYGEDAIDVLRKRQKQMTIVKKIDVPMATWREKCDLIADHTSRQKGYELPEVAERFGWLNTLLRSVADNFELGQCPEGTMRHLEYHGVAIVRIGKKE